MATQVTVTETDNQTTKVLQMRQPLCFGMNVTEQLICCDLECSEFCFDSKKLF